VLDDLLAATAGRSLVLITHDLAALDRVDEVVVLVDGRVQQRGTPDDLRRRPGWYRSALRAGATALSAPVQGRPATVSPVWAQR